MLREVMIEIYYMYIFEDSIMKSTKHCIKKRRETGEWEHNGGGELLQTTLYT
jgi:hypothetical protein